MPYTPASLNSLSQSVLRSFGCDENEASIVANHLVDANLAGHDSHGIGMLPMYGDNVAAGNLIPNQTPEFHEPVGAISVIDAKRGFGHHMALLALDHAMKTVPEHKVAVMAMRNSGHVSRLGTYSEYCAARGYVSIHMVNVMGHAPIVAPYGARQTGFSTNPVSIGMPVDDGEGGSKIGPMLDMATSNIAFGKARVAHNKSEQVPPGSLIDADGLETREPGPMVEDRIGALSAFGAHKGSGLGVFVELLTGALGGVGTVATDVDMPHMVINTMFSIIIDPAAFDDPQSVAERALGYADFIRSREPAKGVDKVLMPGDPENISRAKRRRDGVPVDDETIRQIVETGTKFGLDAGDFESVLDGV